MAPFPLNNFLLASQCLLLNALLVHGQTLGNAEVPVSVLRISERPDVPSDMRRHSDWKPAAFDVHSTSQSGLQHVDGKQCSYMGNVELWSPGPTNFPYPANFPYSIPVTSFLTPRGSIWVGPKEDFYIDTATGVVGAKYSEGSVKWCESLVAKKKESAINLDDCIKGFEQRIDANTLIIAAETIATGADGRIGKWTKDHYTDLCPPLDLEIVRGNPPGPGGPPSEVQLTGIQVTGNTLRLNLKSKHPHYLRVKSIPSKSGTESYTWTNTHYVASVWIDVPSKKLIKAEQNGRSRHIGEDFDNKNLFEFEIFKSKRFDFRPVDGKQQPAK